MGAGGCIKPQRLPALSRPPCRITRASGPMDVPVAATAMSMRESSLELPTRPAVAPGGGGKGGRGGGSCRSWWGGQGRRSWLWAVSASEGFRRHAPCSRPFVGKMGGWKCVVSSCTWSAGSGSASSSRAAAVACSMRAVRRRVSTNSFTARAIKLSVLGDVCIRDAS